MSNGRRASANIDYLPVSGSVDFLEGQRTASVNVTIYADEVPETNEYVFVNLTGLVTLSGSGSLGKIGIV